MFTIKKLTINGEKYLLRSDGAIAKFRNIDEIRGFISNYNIDALDIIVERDEEDSMTEEELDKLLELLVKFDYWIYPSDTGTSEQSDLNSTIMLVRDIKENGHDEDLEEIYYD